MHIKKIGGVLVRGLLFLFLAQNLYSNKALILRFDKEAAYDIDVYSGWFKRSLAKYKEFSIISVKEEIEPLKLIDLNEIWYLKGNIYLSNNIYYIDIYGIESNSLKKIEDRVFSLTEWKEEGLKNSAEDLGIRVARLINGEKLEPYLSGLSIPKVEEKIVKDVSKKNPIESIFTVNLVNLRLNYLMPFNITNISCFNIGLDLFEIFFMLNYKNKYFSGIGVGLKFLTLYNLSETPEKLKNSFLDLIQLKPPAASNATSISIFPINLYIPIFFNYSTPESKNVKDLLINTEFGLLGPDFKIIKVSLIYNITSLLLESGVIFTLNSNYYLKEFIYLYTSIGFNFGSRAVFQ